MVSSGSGTRRAAVKPREDRLLLGISLVIAAVFLFAALDSSAKWLALSGIPPQEVIFVRYGTQLVLMLMWLAPRYGFEAFRTANLKLEIFRALGLMGTTTMNFFAVKYLPLTITSAMLFATPIMTSILSIPMLGEKVGWRRWVAILVGFIGVLIIIQPGGAAFHPAMLLLVVMIFCYAFYNIFNRKLAGVDSPMIQQVYSALIPTLLFLPFVFWDWQWPTNSIDWAVFLSLGLSGVAGHIMLTVAYRYAEASVLSPFVYPQVIFASISSWLVFAQPPGLSIYIGAPIVLGAGFYIWWREREVAVERKRMA